MNELEKYLGSQDFYEDCNAYRHSRDDGSITGAACRFSNLRERIMSYARGEEFVSDYEK